MIIRRLIVPLTVALIAAHAGHALAQSAFPAPLPSGAAAPPANESAFPPVGGALRGSDPAFPPVNGQAPVASVGTAPTTSSFPVNGAGPISSGFVRPPSGPPQGGPPQDCMKDFIPLREDAEKKGKMIKAASDRHAPAEEACKLIRNFGQAELKMMKYVESHAAHCGIPPQVTEQLKGGHKNTEMMEQKVCNAAEQQQTRAPAGPSLSEVLGSATALPEATKTKKGGSTFDTLNGNVLTR